MNKCKFAAGWVLDLESHASVLTFTNTRSKYCLSWACGGLQAVFQRIAQLLSRVVAAGMLLPAPKPPVLPPERACIAVSMTSLLLLGSLLPSLVISHSEVGPHSLVYLDSMVGCSVCEFNGWLAAAE